ncbi:hypothetical protein [Streptomyces tauricus]|uniref:hypothetical protein n=1 Tax=Streptomyces tauricus TaxID=68274 RepID=UPI0034432342
MDVDVDVPVVPRDDAQRRWVARQVTAEDLPGNPPRLGAADLVSPAELRAAGVEMTPGMDVEAQLGGGVRGSGLAPLDQVRLLLTRPGPWPEALDAIAAAVSRRIWRSAFTDFEAAITANANANANAKDGTDGTDGMDGMDADGGRVWDTAVGLVMPSEPHSVLADSRYAGEEFRDAVRQIADLLAAGQTDPRAIGQLAAELAARLRPAWIE